MHINKLRGVVHAKCFEHKAVECKDQSIQLFFFDIITPQVSWRKCHEVRAQLIIHKLGIALRKKLL